ncbi:hypothetical protein [Brachyspira hampsonii]|nr:hypothetical protein [Brachyspira hampsonii]
MNKKSFLLSIMLVSFLTVSCKNNNKDPNNTNKVLNSMHKLGF